jgi:ComF family protein
MDAICPSGWSPFLYIMNIIAKQILTSPHRIFRSLVLSVINFIYPPYCLVCSSQLAESERVICDNCWLDLPHIDQHFDLVSDIRSKLTDEIYFSKVISVWEFSPTIQTAIHHLKYQNFKILANRIGSFMADRLNKLNIPIDKTILLPVPLHKTRTRERGYNQSALLCTVIAVETSLNYNEKILKRIRYTQSQTKLNARERAKNVENAFKVTYPEQISNKLVILVDDVITTGSTMNECAKELVNNGAEDVYLLSAVKA